MGRKSEQQVLTEAIVALTKAVNRNTATLARAMGASAEQSEELIKQLQDRPPVPENETLEEMTKRLAGGLTAGPLQMQVMAEGAKQELPFPVRDRSPLQGMIGRITQRQPSQDEGGETPG